MVDLANPKMEEAKKKLTPEQYNICFLKGTEPPFSGKYTNHHEPGMYQCVVCQTPLFSSDSKFDSKTGWPSFDEALPEAVILKSDDSLGMSRTEVVCKKCGSHLGHVFDDGPTKTGKRYCLNSVCLDLN